MDSKSLQCGLTYIDEDTLPLHCDISSAKAWKELLTNQRSQIASVQYFKNGLEAQDNVQNWPIWKEILIKDFEEVNPLRCTIRHYYTNGWWGYDKGDVFVYTAQSISGAKLLSQERKELIRALSGDNIILKDYLLYPKANDRGQVWISHHSFTEEFKSKFQFPDDYIELFLSKIGLSLKLWDDKKSGWIDMPINKSNSDKLLETIVDKINEVYKELVETKIAEN